MKLKALSNILHDGVTYGTNEELEVIDERQAQALIDAGVAIKVASAEKKEEKQLKDMTKKELMAVAETEKIEGIDEKMTNADIIEIIEAARKA